MTLVITLFKVVTKSAILLFGLIGMFVAYLVLGMMNGWINTYDSDSPSKWTYSGPCKWIVNIVK